MLLGTGVADGTFVLSTASVSWTAVSANDGAESRNSRPCAKSIRQPSKKLNSIDISRAGSPERPGAFRGLRVVTLAREEGKWPAGGSWRHRRPAYSIFIPLHVSAIVLRLSRGTCLLR